VDELARKDNLEFQERGQVSRAGGTRSVARPRGALLKPQTFMNLSGRAVGAMAQFYKIAPAEILVVHDELDLLPGYRAPEDGRRTRRSTTG